MREQGGDRREDRSFRRATAAVGGRGRGDAAADRGRRGGHRGGDGGRQRTRWDP